MIESQNFMIKEINDSVTLEVKLVHPQAKIPYRKRTTDASYDIYSVEDKELAPGCATIVHTGIHISAPPGYYYTIDGRSSLWLRGIEPNRGIIDATYTGEIIVSLVNFSPQSYLNRIINKVLFLLGSSARVGPVYKIKSGDRIAQITLHKQYHASFKIVSEFSAEYNQRGVNGFGSSGA